MKKLLFLQITALLFILSCTEQKSNSNTITKAIDHSWLDSIIKASDSSYIKPYKRTDFVTAYFYVNKKDSSVCQLMKDSVDSIRQIVIARKNVRTFFAQYYPSGQLEADLPIDEFGQYNGPASYYYPNGHVESSGNYEHGIKTGQWKNFDETGKLTTTVNYDKNGQPVK